ncbi:MAG: N-acetyltransferase [Pseudomonadota bacterium]
MSVNSSSFIIRLETPSDVSAVEQLTALVFGPAMFARAAFALREGVAPEPACSFVAEIGSQIVGTVRQTPINWGDKTALMLGPLGVSPAHKSAGIGRALMTASVEAARGLCADGGPKVIMLVGDLDYYKPFGFRQISHGKITLPRPADPARILVCELEEGAAKSYSGVASSRRTG